jgi:hypothetical protein
MKPKNDAGEEFQDELYSQACALNYGFRPSISGSVTIRFSASLVSYVLVGIVG